jgi:hypothetical protein
LAGASLGECPQERQALSKIEGEREKKEPSAAVGYWITSSARHNSDGGIVRPSALAVLRLISRSNFVDCSTSRSAGLAPLEDAVANARAGSHEHLRIGSRGSPEKVRQLVLQRQLGDEPTVRVKEWPLRRHDRLRAAVRHRLEGTCEIFGPLYFDLLLL